jgi:hypothetical protein
LLRIGGPFVGIAVQLAALVISYAGVGGAAAPADAACDAGDSWVLVEVQAAAWTPAQRERVVADLRRSLAGQGIAACLAGQRPPAAPLATLAIVVPEGAAPQAAIEIRDAVTQKRVRREVDLAGIPPDGREVAIAIEADELLRASWAEIALDTARARAAAVRPQVAGSVRQVFAPARVQSWGALGARAAFERTLGGAGVALFGGDAVLRLRLAPRLALELAAGARVSPSVAAPHGQVRGLAAGGEAALLVRALGTGRRATLEVGPAFSAGWLRWTGEPFGADRGSSAAGALLIGRLRVAARLPLGRALHLIAAADAGGVLRGLDATDAGQVVAGASGALLGASLALEAP